MAALLFMPSRRFTRRHGVQAPLGKSNPLSVSYKCICSRLRVCRRGRLYTKCKAETQLDAPSHQDLNFLTILSKGPQLSHWLI